MIPLKRRLKYMLGVRSERMKYTLNGATVARGYYLFFGFYWFAFALFWKWPLEMESRYASGAIFSYRPTPDLKEGDLMWTRNRKLLRTDYLEDYRHAA